MQNTCQVGITQSIDISVLFLEWGCSNAG